MKFSLHSLKDFECSFAKLVFLVFLPSFFLKFCRPFSNWSFDLVGAFKMVICVQDFILV